MDRPVRSRRSSPRPVRRPPETGTFECPRCDRLLARIIGRSEILPVVYLRCDGCRLTSIVGA